MKEIDVEKIMEEIRAEIKKRGETEEILAFQEVKESDITGECFNETIFKNELYQANLNYCNAYYFELSGKGKNGMKRMLRKLNAFLGVPIVEKQNTYNANVVRLLNQVQLYIDAQEQKQRELERLIEKLEERIITLERK